MRTTSWCAALLAFVLAFAHTTAASTSAAPGVVLIIILAAYWRQLPHLHRVSGSAYLREPGARGCNAGFSRGTARDGTACLEGWVRGAGTLISDAGQQRARKMMDYYVVNSLRGKTERLEKLGGRGLVDGTVSVYFGWNMTHAYVVSDGDLQHNIPLLSLLPRSIVRAHRNG
jgi:hypothetical protein